MRPGELRARAAAVVVLAAAIAACVATAGCSGRVPDAFVSGAAAGAWIVGLCGTLLLALFVGAVGAAVVEVFSGKKNGGAK